jgi:hypothetical protein
MGRAQWRDPGLAQRWNVTLLAVVASFEGVGFYTAPRALALPTGSPPPRGSRPPGFGWAWRGQHQGVEKPSRTRMIYVGEAPAIDRPRAGVTLLARSRLAERMQRIRDDGQRGSQDVVDAGSGTLGNAYG